MNTLTFLLALQSIQALLTRLRMVAQGLQTDLNNMIDVVTMPHLRSDIRTYLNRHDLRLGKNIYTIQRLICGVNQNNISMTKLDSLGGYRFGLFDNEFAPPTLQIPIEELGDLESLVYWCRKYLRRGVRAGVPINDDFPAKYRENCLMFSVFALTYQEFGDLEIDTKSKKWDLVPRSSDHLNRVSISNKTLYYLARETRIFDIDEIVRVLLPNGKEAKLLDKYVVSSGFHRILWQLCFHTTIQEALRAKQGVARIKF